MSLSLKFLFLFFLLFSVPSFAANGIGEFFSEVLGFFQGVWFFITVTIPDTISSFFAWIFSFALYLYYLSILSSLIFAHDVAISFLDLIDISGVINSAVTALPADLRQVAVDIRFFEALTLIVEAFITRMVYKW